MTLIHQLMISSAYCAGAAFTFQWTHQLLRKKASEGDTEVENLFELGPFFYGILGLFAFFWPASWIFCFSLVAPRILRRFRAQHLRCRRASRVQCEVRYADLWRLYRPVRYNVCAPDTAMNVGWTHRPGVSDGCEPSQ